MGEGLTKVFNTIKRMNKKKIYQGEIAKVIRNEGTEHSLHVFINSSDFPDYDIIVMGANGKFEVERVPINEEIWQKIGESLGYRFRKSKKVLE